MGTWYLSLAACIFLIFIGMFLHWSIVMLGLILPFVPMTLLVLKRRRERKINDRET
jgi:Mn2+/Fe2+ NRAMP family transporter